MPSIGVITCEILELEFAEILTSDPEIARITLLHTHSCHGFIEAIEQRTGTKPRSIVHISEFSPASDGHVDVLVHVLELGLHTVINNLQNAVVTAAHEMGPYVSAIFLGYGLCGNALNHVEDLMSDVEAPVFVPMDEDHPVDDCIGLIIGGREKYYAAQCQVAGTMFMNSGFARHWKDMLFKLYPGAEETGSVMFRRLLANYERSLLLPTRVMAEKDMILSTKEFTKTYGLRTEVQAGTMEILDSSWAKVKEFVSSL